MTDTVREVAMDSSMGGDQVGWRPVLALAALLAFAAAVPPAQAGVVSSAAGGQLTVSVTPTSWAVGSLDPGKSATTTVQLSVTYSNAYTITRDVIESSPETMGLSVSGPGVGAKPRTGPPTRTYTDTVVVTMPWTATPGSPHTGSIRYTVVPQ